MLPFQVPYAQVTLMLTFIDVSTDTIQSRVAEEQFLKDIVYDMADLFIYVVNQITAREEIDLDNTTRRLADNKSPCYDMLVIHNFKSAANKETEDNLFQRFVNGPYGKHGKLAPVEKTYNNVKRTIRYVQATNQRHFYTLQEDSEYGKRHNECIFSLLRENLQNLVNTANLSKQVQELRKKPLEERIAISCSKLLCGYLEDAPEFSKEEQIVVIKEHNKEKYLQLSDKAQQYFEEKYKKEQPDAKSIKLKLKGVVTSQNIVYYPFNTNEAAKIENKLSVPVYYHFDSN